MRSSSGLYGRVSPRTGPIAVHRLGNAELKRGSSPHSLRPGDRHELRGAKALRPEERKQIILQVMNP